MNYKVLEKIAVPILIVLCFLFLPDWLSYTAPGAISEWFMSTPLVRLGFKIVGIVIALLYLPSILSMKNKDL